MALYTEAEKAEDKVCTPVTTANSEPVTNKAKILLLESRGKGGGERERRKIERGKRREGIETSTLVHSNLLN